MYGKNKQPEGLATAAATDTRYRVHPPFRVNEFLINCGVSGATCPNQLTRQELAMLMVTSPPPLSQPQLSMKVHLGSYKAQPLHNRRAAIPPDISPNLALRGSN